MSQKDKRIQKNLVQHALGEARLSSEQRREANERDPEMTAFAEFFRDTMFPGQADAGDSDAEEEAEEKLVVAEAVRNPVPVAEAAPVVERALRRLAAGREVRHRPTPRRRPLVLLVGGGGGALLLAATIMFAMLFVGKPSQQFPEAAEGTQQMQAVRQHALGEIARSSKGLAFRPTGEPTHLAGERLGFLLYLLASQSGGPDPRARLHERLRDSGAPEDLSANILGRVTSNRESARAHLTREDLKHIATSLPEALFRPVERGFRLGDLYVRLGAGSNLGPALQQSGVNFDVPPFSYRDGALWQGEHAAKAEAIVQAMRVSLL